MKTKFGVVVALVAAFVVGPVLPAQAADTWIYVVVNDRVCGSGNSVRGILANVPQTGWTLTRWDDGDNVVYPRVRLNASNQFIAQVRCEKKVGWFWRTVGYRTVSQFIRPSYSGQTIWVG